MKDRTVLGVLLESWRRKTELSMVAMHRQGGVIRILWTEQHAGDTLDLLGKLRDAVNCSPIEIEEIWAGNQQTLDWLLHLRPMLMPLMLSPIEPPLGGEHVMACIHRLQRRE